MLRKLYQERGCSFTLGVLLREPSSLYYSDYLFEGIPSRKPFAEFMGQDIQSSALLGWPFGWNSKRVLTPAHRNQTYEMLDQFDLVGLTECFDESLLLLARDGGLPWPMYRRMNGQAAGFTNLGASSAACEFDARCPMLCILCPSRPTACMRPSVSPVDRLSCPFLSPCRSSRSHAKATSDRAARRAGGGSAADELRPRGLRALQAQVRGAAGKRRSRLRLAREAR